MNILIVGSQGFIGRHLADYFLRVSATVTGCDLVENNTAHYRYHKVSVLSPDFESLLTDSDFDVCINASGSGNVAWSLEHPSSDFEANTLLVSRILDSIRKHQPRCKFIQISSAAVYGNPQSLPVNENHAPAPLSPYGFHKWMSEIICAEYSLNFNIPIVIIRPFSVYGTGLKKQLFWDICQKTERSETISLFGTGAESRDFIHVDDLVKSISLIIEMSAFKCEVYNIASGKETRIAEISEMFEKHFKGKIAVSFSGEEKKGDPNNWRADVSKLISLGFSPEKHLSEGLPEYINWFLQIRDER